MAELDKGVVELSKEMVRSKPARYDRTEAETGYNRVKSRDQTIEYQNPSGHSVELSP